MSRASASEADQIAAVRRFNRFYTQKLGVLQSAWLDSPFSLTEARVLYEIRQRERPTARDIARDLDIDAGYLSRLLRRFEKDGLIGRVAAPDDGRQSILSLTSAGKTAFAPLEARTVEQVGRMLGRLSARDRERLVASMETIETLTRSEAVAPSACMVTLRQPRPGDLGWVVKRHAELYAEEYGWIDGFEAVCAQIVADFAAKHDLACERAWIADMGGRNVGSVLLVRDSETVARLRLLIVDPIARGRGVGTCLTDACISFARACGYRRITLWTHEELTAARLIYARAGFKLTSRELRRSFGNDVVSEHWDLDL